MTIDWLGQYARIAAEMDRIRALAGAEIGYDVLSDAITWSDEYPSDLAGRLEEFDCIKILLRYRTSVLMGDPDESFKPYWDRAMELFPNWAGFRPSRLVASDELKEFYEHSKKHDMRYLKKILRCSDLDREASPGDLGET